MSILWNIPIKFHHCQLYWCPCEYITHVHMVGLTFSFTRNLYGNLNFNIINYIEILCLSEQQDMWVVIGWRESAGSIHWTVTYKILYIKSDYPLPLIAKSRDLPVDHDYTNNWYCRTMWFSNKRFEISNQNGTI